MVAKGMSMREDLLMLAAATPVNDKGTLNRVAENAKEAAFASSRANLGTALHSLTEQLDRGEHPAIPMQLIKDIEAYQKATTTHEFVAISAEKTVVIPKFKVAGTYDRILAKDSDLYIGDIKTGSTIEFSFLEIAVQLALYAHGVGVWNNDEQKYEPMPNVHQDCGVVFHMPAGEGRCDLYLLDLNAGWEIAKLCYKVRNYRLRSRKLVLNKKEG